MRPLVGASIVVIVAAGPALADGQRAKPCVVSVASPGNQLSIDGVELPDYERATLERVLGKPDRVEKITTKQRHERWSFDRSKPPTSTMRTITDLHYVYDARGLVFPTRRTAEYDQREAADRMIVFLAHPRTFDHQAPPPVYPKQRGTCRLEINGVVVDARKDARPAGITYRTNKLDLYKTKVGPTSYTTSIDSLYALEGFRSFRLFLDAPATGRPSYAEIR
jgi:hypothetical protein